MSDIPQPNIPQVGSGVDSNVRRGFDAIRGFFDKLTKAGGVLTKRDLGGLLGSDGSLSMPWLDTTIPPKVAGVTATGAFRTIILEWDDMRYANLAYYEVWRSETASFTDAARIGTTNALVYSDAPPTASISKTYWYWVRAVSNALLVGPWSDSVSAATANDPAYLMELLTQRISSAELSLSLNSKIAQIDAMATAAYVDGKIAGIVSSFDPSGLAGMQDVVSQSAMWNMLTTANIASANLQYRTNADAIQAESVLRTALSSTVAGNYSLFLTEQATRADADAANTASITALAAVVSTAQAAIITEQTARASGDSANASSITTLQTTVNGHTASIQTQQSSIDGTLAQYTIKLDVNGKVAGIGLMNSGATSDFIAKVDNFAIAGTGATDVYPFIVSGGVTYMKAAMIQDATITNAKIQSLAADKLFASSGTIASAIIGSGHITDAMIGNYIASSNYNGSTTDPYTSPGTAGWCIAKGGNAGFNNVRVRGDVEASSLKANTLMVNTGHINDLAVNTLKIADYAVTIPSSAYTEGTISVPNGSEIAVTGGAETVIQTLVVDNTYPLILTCGAGISSTQTYYYLGVRIYRGATLIYSATLPNSTTWSVSIKEATGQSSVTYTVRVFNPSGANGGYAANRIITSLVTKR